MRIVDLRESLDLDAVDALLRPPETETNVDQTVAGVVGDVRERGDEALFEYTAKFDGVSIDGDRIRVSEDEIREIAAGADDELVEILRVAASNIRQFHEEQIQESWEIYAGDGVHLGQRVTPIESAGLYIPGFKAAYPSSVLMNAIPAQVAGVGRIVVTTPPRSLEENPLVAAALNLLGLYDVYRIGGDPAWAAADLLAQAEHDEMARVWLICWSEDLAAAVFDQVQLQLETLDRSDIARMAVANNGISFIVGGEDDALELTNHLAPEHVEVLMAEPDRIADGVRHAGAVFVGRYSPAVVGDYFAGPNHVLPTGRSARFFSPLGVYDFLKRTSVVRYSGRAIERSGSMIEKFAIAEGLTGHARSITIRGH